MAPGRGDLYHLGWLIKREAVRKAFAKWLGVDLVDAEHEELGRQVYQVWVGCDFEGELVTAVDLRDLLMDAGMARAEAIETTKNIVCALVPLHPTSASRVGTFSADVQNARYFGAPIDVQLVERGLVAARALRVSVGLGFPDVAGYVRAFCQEMARLETARGGRAWSEKGVRAA